MKRTAMKAILAVLAGVFGVGTAAAEGGSGSFTQFLSEALAKISAYLPPEVNRALLELLGQLGIGL